MSKRTRPRQVYLVPWADVVDIFGGDEEAAMRALKVERPSHGRDATKSKRSRFVNDGVPVQNIGPQIHAAWKGKLPRRVPEPEPLRLAVDRLRELYRISRGGDMRSWNAINDILHMAVGALPRVGERYRPNGADPPGAAIAPSGR